MTLRDAALDAVFSALADPTRRAILARLAEGDAYVGDLAEPFHISLPAVSKHLGVLESVGLVGREREGRAQRCRLVAAPMRDAAAWLARYQAFWDARLDGLEQFLAAGKKKEDSRPWSNQARRTPRSASDAASRRRAKRSSAPGRSPKR